MKRFGMYSGKIYDEDVDVTTIKECCLVFKDELKDDDKQAAKCKCGLCQMQSLLKDGKLPCDAELIPINVKNLI